MKKIPVTLMIHTYYEIPDDASEDNIQYFIEEKMCNQELFELISKEIVTLPEGICCLCSKSQSFFGHINFEKFKTLLKPFHLCHNKV